jgi:hypothetical protein
MTLDIETALRDGFDRTTTRNGGVLAAAFVALGLVSTTVNQSLVRVWAESILDELAENPPSLEGTDLTTEEYQDLISEIRDTVGETLPISYLESLSVPELLALVFVLAFVAEAIRLVAIRVFVSHETESIPRALVTRNLGWAVLNGVVGGIIAGILIAVASIFLIIPGIFLAISFLFLRQEIAVEDKNFVEALSGSWELTSGNRLELFVLVVVLVLIGPIVSFVIGLAGNSAPVAILEIVATSLVLTYTVAVVSRAYDQLRGERVQTAGADTAPEEFDDIDDDLLP